jgi:hypothetical protein
MDRRELLKTGLLSAAALGLGAEPGKEHVLENQMLSWRLKETASGIQSIRYGNKLSGQSYEITGGEEWRVFWAGTGPRVEIPWWDFAGGSDEEAYATAGFDSSKWAKVATLAGGRMGRIYDGYAWFRTQVNLPTDGQGQPIHFVLGGYDQQDWNEYWVYVNGALVGQRTSSGRWRTPGHFVVKPGDGAYGGLRFGGPNVVAVRTHSYNLTFAGLNPFTLDRYVFRPYLFDQFVTVGEPFLDTAKMELRGVKQESATRLRVDVAAPEVGLEMAIHYALAGNLRQKKLEVRNAGSTPRLLLDMVVDDMALAAATSVGGHGEPVFTGDDGFCGLEHPAGVNQGDGGHVRLWHSPGRTLKSGESFVSSPAVFGVGRDGEGLESFHNFLLARSPRMKKKIISLYTPYGINNQWGACPALTEGETFDVLQTLKGWQGKGVKFDFFTLDQGWLDPTDQHHFTPACFPEDGAEIVKSVSALGMKFGLWFATSNSGWSDGLNPKVQASASPSPGQPDVPPTLPPVGNYRNGYPAGGGIGRVLCMASDAYWNEFKASVMYHVRENGARVVKVDNGGYYCNSTKHGHLPGRYSTEAIYNRLMELGDAVREAAPDALVIWYWGVGSPFWALHGDMVFESGLFMEGSGTSWHPTLYYRDAVTLSLDQNTQFAKAIPGPLKDSLGVWLSQIRWGNFMGRERWREAVVMDLGRGSLLWPQLWGDPNLLDDDDLRFLAGMMALVKKNERVFLRNRRTFGDSLANEPYGYAFFEGGHGFVIAHNAHFSSRKLRLPLGRELAVAVATGTPLSAISHFPERSRVTAVDGADFQVGSTAEVWMRPFETLMLEFAPGKAAPSGTAARQFNPAELGVPLQLAAAEEAPWMQLQFADKARFEASGKVLGVTRYRTRLPAFGAARGIIAIPIRLRRGEREYRHIPVVAEIVALKASVDGREIQMTPVPEARQFGNTQSAGCSWVVYKLPVSERSSGKQLEFAVHTYLPPGVSAQVEAWFVRHWWHNRTRPQADGHYGDAPS